MGMAKQRKRGRRKPAASARPALDRLRETWAAMERERRRAVAGLESSLQAVQARLDREGKALGRSVRETVQSTLAALDIPSREEIARLTRRVEALSRRLDARKR
jgi:polyhydroxyalkanoate synthesis regulator phasin